MDLKDIQEILDTVETKSHEDSNLTPLHMFRK
jgi:hypothetical protein